MTNRDRVTVCIPPDMQPAWESLLAHAKERGISGGRLAEMWVRNGLQEHLQHTGTAKVVRDEVLRRMQNKPARKVDVPWN